MSQGYFINHHRDLVREMLPSTLNMWGHERILWGWAAQGHTAELPDSLDLKLVLFPLHHRIFLIFWGNALESFVETTEQGTHGRTTLLTCNFFHCHWSVHWSLHSFESPTQWSSCLELALRKTSLIGVFLSHCLCAKLAPAEGTNVLGFPNQRPGWTSTQGVICGTINRPPSSPKAEQESNSGHLIP